MAVGYAKFRAGSVQLRKECDQETSGQTHRWRESEKGFHVTIGWLQSKLHISSSTPPVFCLQYPAWVPWRKRTQCLHQHGWGKKGEGKNNGYGCIWKGPLQISLLSFSIQLKMMSLQSPAVYKKDLTILVSFSPHEDLINWHPCH